MNHFKVIDDHTGKETAYTMPESWHEVTTDQYIKLRTEYKGNDAHLLEILSGNPRESWARQSVAFVENTLILVSWIGEKEIDFDELEIPVELVINDNRITIPKDLGLETFGQKMLIDNHIGLFIQNQVHSKEPAGTKKYSVIKLIDYIAAVYLCKWIVGKDRFDAGDMDIALMHVRNTPAYLIYPIAGFFFEEVDRLNRYREKIVASRKTEDSKDSKLRKKAGAERLEKFGDMLTVVNIAQFMGGWTLDYTEGLSFYEIINLSLLQAEVTDYQGKLSELKQEQLRAKYAANRKHYRR